MRISDWSSDVCSSDLVENLAVEQFVAKRPIEAFVVAVLPGRRWGYVECLHADLFQPFLDCCREELAAIIRPDIGRRYKCDDKVVQLRTDCFVFEFSRSNPGQQFAPGLTPNPT